MTSKQARRAAKILRDLATSLPCVSHEKLKSECHDLARALDRDAERLIIGFYLNDSRVEYDKELFDERRADYSAGIAG